MSEQSVIFLANINKQLSEGQFDNEITIPFMTRELIRLMIQKRMDKKIQTGSTPLLSDQEVKEAIEEAKLTAAETAAIFLEMGLLEYAEEGMQVSDKWKDVLKTI